MTIEHPLWAAFIEDLQGPEGCNFREDAQQGGFAWECHHGEGDSFHFSRRILRDMGFNPVRSLQWAEENGGGCDCEIVLNLGKSMEDLLHDRGLQPATRILEGYYWARHRRDPLPYIVQVGRDSDEPEVLKARKVRDDGPYLPLDEFTFLAFIGTV